MKGSNDRVTMVIMKLSKRLTCSGGMTVKGAWNDQR